MTDTGFAYIDLDKLPLATDYSSEEEFQACQDKLDFLEELLNDPASDSSQKIIKKINERRDILRICREKKALDEVVQKYIVPDDDDDGWRRRMRVKL